MRYLLLLPLLRYDGMDLIMSNCNFILLVVSTVLLAAAGYIINDINDVDADKINKPEKVIVGRFIRIRTAENLHLILNAIAIAIGIYISFSIGIRSVSIAFVLVSGLLYFYSSTYKGQLILGNLMVAFFAAIVPFMVVLFELPLLKIKYKDFEGMGTLNFNYIIAWFGYYALFAFLISLVREIIKDIEDFEGDKAYGERTLPVVLGVRVSKGIVLSLIFLTLGLLLFCVVRYLKDPLSVAYIISCVAAPVAFIGWKILFAHEKKDYSKASLVCKLTMLTGIAYILIVKFVLLGN
jgi:4-hydroxybenzoate polyprenyltransferase